ncbi:FAD-binding domain-containing protein [Cryphonectria parasitica EP155]|uniref:FAD-binding domain-containing protein n=1 Tax=Cryphonectria parasitica (strain ATCC 38755 / EP155) TaxID=660469 RepID=A0A9P5CMA6_CRYP1|nr:FAD-binding domain-containing protein [Cryphonectria parasitica EP155]KAF3762891.1 FAD-binding domain-containing protein [Cryphonectria parasitica EP155]
MVNLTVLASLQDCLNGVCAGRSNCVAYASDSDPLYQIEWVKAYNLAIDVTPTAVIRPNSTQEVAATVQCAAENGIKVQARSGGHSYANFGLGDEAVAVDMTNLQDYSMNETTWYATIGAGMKLGDVDRNLHKTGRAFAHGVCPGVGLGGHATVGGLGPMSRMWGTALDHVVEVEMVTANGTILHVNERLNPDMFYGVQGAGASFGIITEFVMRTHPEPEEVAQFTFDFTFGVEPSKLADSYIQWQKLIADPSLDRRFGSQLVISPIGVTITGTFYGSAAEWNASGILSRLPQNGSVIFTDWPSSLTAWTVQEALYLSDTPSHFYSKSLGLRQQDLLSEYSATKLFQYLESQPKGTLLWFIVFDSSGGAVADVPMNATAFAHRNKIMFYQSYAVDAVALSNETWSFLTNFHNNLVEVLPLNATGRGTYPGYVDLNISGVPQGQYWESNLPALQILKSKWDPNDVFHNPQSVQPVEV